MPGATTELNLATAVDADDNADYLTLSLAASLRTVDALFNNVSGHNHGGAHQGGPLTIGAGQIPDGTITSAKILDGTIATADIAAGAITQPLLAKPAVGTPELIDAAVTAAKIGAHAVSRIVMQVFSGTISTASGTFVNCGDLLSWTPVSAGCDILVLYQGSFAQSVTGALGQFFVGWNGSNVGGPMLIQQGATPNYMVPIHLVGYIGPSTHGGVLGQIGMSWATNTPSLSSSWTRNLLVLELNK